MSKPVLLLDIDGTLIPFGLLHHDSVADIHPDEPCEVIDVLIHNKWDVKAYIPHRHIEMVNQLAEYFDIQWFTGWDQHARQVEGVFGLGELPIITTNTRFSGGPRKHEALKWWLEDELLGRRGFVWIDDDELRLFEKSDIPEGSLGILVKDPHVGMTQADVDEAINWAKERNDNLNNA